MAAVRPRSEEALDEPPALESGTESPRAVLCSRLVTVVWIHHPPLQLVNAPTICKPNGWIHATAQGWIFRRHRARSTLFGTAPSSRRSRNSSRFPRNRRCSTQRCAPTVQPPCHHAVQCLSRNHLCLRQWETNGLLDQSIQVLVDWVRAQNVEGLTVDIVAKKGFTPVIFVEVEPTAGGSDAGTVLMYGHADTQPPFVGWNEDLDPYKANLKGEKLYGRGACDDGYSIFCAVSSIMAVKAQGLDHGRLLVLVEASEESGSIHLPQHLCVHPVDTAPQVQARRCSTVPTMLAGGAEQGHPKRSDRHPESHRLP